jgi:hypothetical protein
MKTKLVFSMTSSVTGQKLILQPRLKGNKTTKNKLLNHQFATSRLGTN